MIRDNLLLGNKKSLVKTEDPKSLFDLLFSIGKFSSKGVRLDFAYAFAAILVLKDRAYNIRHIIDSMPYKAENFDIVDLMNSMVSLGYKSNHIDGIEIFDIDERLFPAVFITNNFKLLGNEGEVLILQNYTSDGDHIEAYSSKTKEKVILEKKDNAVGSAYFFEHYNPQDDISSKQIRQNTGQSWFSTLIGRFMPDLRAIFMFSIVIALLSLISPIFVLSTYHLIVQPGTLNSLPVLVTGAIIVVLIDMGVRKIRSAYLVWVGTRIDNIACKSIFEQLIRLPASMVEGAPVSSQINRLKSFEAIRDAVTGPLFVTISELPFVGVLLFVFAMISGWLALVPATAIFIYILMFSLLQNRTRIGLVTAAGEAAEKSKIQLETFEKIDSIKYSGMSEIWFNQFREKSGRASLQNFKSSFDHSVINILAQGIATITAISTIFFGVHMIWDGNLSTGALVASMLITWKVLSPMQSMLGMLPRFEQTKFSIDQVNRLIDLETEDYHHSATLELVKFKGSIKFSNVGIRYTKEKDPVLVGLDLEIAPGELVMITGTNGTGKSTMLNLVNGLYFPQAGSIKIDGIDIRQLDPLLLRHNVAYVSQNPEFFFGTIIQNLRLAEPLALDEEIKEALFMADALDDIAKLPLGLKTIMLKDNNANNIPTSLGYKLNLARAYISRAQIYLIDELPYSLLNSKTGDNLMENLKRWRGKKTVLMVTHRNDYIKIADKAVLLANDGRHYIGYPEDIMEYIKKINTKNIRYI